MLTLRAPHYHQQAYTFQTYPAPQLSSEPVQVLTLLALLVQKYKYFRFRLIPSRLTLPPQLTFVPPPQVLKCTCFTGTKVLILTQLTSRSELRQY
jgi:hypothetical protein